MNQSVLSSLEGQQLISSDEALKIARIDAETVYGNLTFHRIGLSLEENGWHVDYELKDATLNGGGPHYVIDSVRGVVVSRRYEQ